MKGRTAWMWIVVWSLNGCAGISTLPVSGRGESAADPETWHRFANWTVSPEPSGAPARAGSPGLAEAIELLPLVRWEDLMSVRYEPRSTISWPRRLVELDGRTVRVEGFLVPRWGAQDPTDLLITIQDPTTIACGPVDMTSIVMLRVPEFPEQACPHQPVEVIGTFHLSNRPNDLQPIYELRGTLWRPLATTDQRFPGVDADRRDDTRFRDQPNRPL